MEMLRISWQKNLSQSQIPTCIHCFLTVLVLILQIIMWCGQPDAMCETTCDLWGQLLRSNGHYREVPQHFTMFPYTVDCRTLDKLSCAVKLSVGNFSRAHNYGNIVIKSLKHIAHMKVVTGFILDNSNKPVSTANFTDTILQLTVY